MNLLVGRMVPMFDWLMVSLVGRPTDRSVGYFDWLVGSLIDLLVGSLFFLGGGGQGGGGGDCLMSALD